MQSEMTAGILLTHDVYHEQCNAIIDLWYDGTVTKEIALDSLQKLTERRDEQLDGRS